MFIQCTALWNSRFYLHISLSLFLLWIVYCIRCTDCLNLDSIVALIICCSFRKSRFLRLHTYAALWLGHLCLSLFFAFLLFFISFLLLLSMHQCCQSSAKHHSNIKCTRHTQTRIRATVTTFYVSCKKMVNSSSWYKAYEIADIQRAHQMPLQMLFILRIVFICDQQFSFFSVSVSYMIRLCVPRTELFILFNFYGMMFIYRRCFFDSSFGWWLLLFLFLRRVYWSVFTILLGIPR